MYLFSEPEYLANPNLDELSGMTYLSYFMKEEDSPGYYATLNWVKNQIPHQRINNFRVSTYQLGHFSSNSRPIFNRGKRKRRDSRYRYFSATFVYTGKTCQNRGFVGSDQE